MLSTNEIILQSFKMQFGSTTCLSGWSPALAEEQLYNQVENPVLCIFNQVENPVLCI